MLCSNNRCLFTLDLLGCTQYSYEYYIASGAYVLALKLTVSARCQCKCIAKYFLYNTLLAFISCSYVYVQTYRLCISLHHCHNFHYTYQVMTPFYAFLDMHAHMLVHGIYKMLGKIHAVDCRSQTLFTTQLTALYRLQ